MWYSVSTGSNKLDTTSSQYEIPVQRLIVIKITSNIPSALAYEQKKLISLTDDPQLTPAPEGCTIGQVGEVRAMCLRPVSQMPGSRAVIVHSRKIADRHTWSIHYMITENTCKCNDVTSSVVKSKGVWYFVETRSICLKLYFLESRK